MRALAKVLTTGQKAAAYFRRTGRVNGCAYALTGMAYACLVGNEGDSARKYLAECRALYPQLRAERRDDFYDVCLMAAYEGGGADSIRKVLAEYVAHVPPSRWDHLTLARACTEIRDFGQARRHVARYEKLRPSAAGDLRYYAVLYGLYRKQEKYKEADEAHRRFDALRDSALRVSWHERARLSEVQRRLRQDVREAQQARRRYVGATVCGVGVLLLLVGLRYCRQAEREKARYRRQHEQLAEQYRQLQQYNDRLKARVHEAVSHRLALLNDFVKAHLAGDGSESESRIVRQLADRETFMQAVREAFAVSHPDFIGRLEQQGLTDWEVGYCCLYALGLNGKEVSRYIHSGACYKTNSIIRKKLGLDSHSTNLNLYIRQLLEEEEEPTS